MTEIKLYINKEVAEICACSVEAVRKFAQVPANKIHFAGTGRRKIFIWFEEDILRFQNREKPGRPAKK